MLTTKFYYVTIVLYNYEKQVRVKSQKVLRSNKTWKEESYLFFYIASIFEYIWLIDETESDKGILAKLKVAMKLNLAHTRSNQIVRVKAK